MIRDIPKGIGTKSGIYKITNLINGKFYVGSTKNFSSRYRTHLYSLKSSKSGCNILQNAINKYGIENFKFSIIKVCDNYQEEEITFFKKKFPSYNAVKETKLKMSLARKGKIAWNKGVKNYNYTRYKKKIAIYKNKEYTIQKLADLLSVSVQAIYQKIKRNNLKLKT